jgi:hypothetical protein
MAKQSRLISGGVNYYIEGGGEYTGSGSPWTSVATSPYEIGMNSTAGVPYTPLAPLRQEVYGGGAPISDGANALYTTYGNQTETITIQCRATTYDNAIFLLIQLRQILNTALFTTPCILAEQPNGASNAVYFEILGADVQEDYRFLNDEAGLTTAGHAVIRAVVTWRKKPFGGRLSSGETLINAVTMTNGTIRAYTTGGGDMINEGSPLNIKWNGGATNTYQRLWMGTVLERIADTAGAGAYSTSSTTGVSIATASNILANEAYAYAAVKVRIMLILTTVNTLTQLRIQVRAGDTTATPVYTSPWITPPVAAAANILDMGAVDLSPFRAMNYPITTVLAVTVYQRSSTGGSATVTYASMHVISYLTWGMAEAVTIPFFGDVRTLSFQERTSAPVLPIAPPIVGASSDGTTFSAVHLLRGQAPRYYPNTALYLAWVRNTYTYTAADTAPVTATHAPLWHTLRGAT